MFRSLNTGLPFAIAFLHKGGCRITMPCLYFIQHLGRLVLGEGKCLEISAKELNAPCMNIFSITKHPNPTCCVFPFLNVGGGTQGPWGEERQRAPARLGFQGASN